MGCLPKRRWRRLHRRIFGVIGESLRIHIGVVANDFDGVLVGADGTIGAQAPEFAAGGAFGGSVRHFYLIQGQMGHVVHNADGEALLGIGLLAFSYSGDLAGVVSLEPRP